LHQITIENASNGPDSVNLADHLSLQEVARNQSVARECSRHLRHVVKQITTWAFADLN
jgi:hypothetical protein